MTHIYYIFTTYDYVFTDSIFYLQVMAELYALRVDTVIQ